MNLKSILAGAALSLVVGASQAATLVAHYTFSNAGNLGADTSGFGNNASTVNNISQVAGPTTGSLAGAFNQSSQFDVGPLNGYTGLPGFSLVAWVYVDGSNGGYNGVISQDFGGCCVNRLLLTGGTNPFINVGQHVDKTLAEGFATGSWYQIALTGANQGGGAVGHVYVDGVELADSPQTFGSPLPDLSTAKTYLGAGENGGPYRLNGDLADVRIYQGALTASEVAGLYAGVPESSAWTLMLIGFAGLGAAVRATRRTVTA